MSAYVAFLTSSLSSKIFNSFFFQSSPVDMLVDFRKRGRKEDRVRNINVRETHLSAASHMCSDRGQIYIPFG